MHVCVFGRGTRHIALSPSQIYTLTKDFIAARHQRAIESVAQSLNWTETWLACLDPLGDTDRMTVPPTQCPLPLLAGLQSHAPGHSGAQSELALVTPDAQ